MFSRILIIKPSALGDVIHALPLLKLLRGHYPQAQIAWLVNRELQGLLEGHPDLDRIFPFERRVWGERGRLSRTLREFAALIRQLRQARFDLALDVQGLLRSGLIGYLSGAPHRLGFANAREGSPLFYTQKAAVPPGEVHAVERYLCLLSALGIATGAEGDREGPLSLDFTFPLGEADRLYARGLLEGRRAGSSLILMSPGARWESKRWPPEHFAWLADLLSERERATVALIGSPAETPLAESIRAQMKTAPLLLTGRTSLKQLAALMEAADLLVTNDSGPMHLAAALGTPVLALFGPTSPRRTGPYGVGHRVLQKTLPCIPCFKRQCPEDHRCLRGLGVKEVLEAVRELI
ncbi:MAG: lipopolysaccharide heptosyltransferase II [Candidatus Tectomicrobia bacterium]|uniref:lipopolysaccharide heptosyltransferase II n=1 Tax=Tectimicrobiota bacterium TaxID=2528274 RepID=A0A932CP46_UNCTE|nr:lipopolysaccharide heptosyltransferase II [Candidatus Tectomicrobia bacterium]